MDEAPRRQLLTGARLFTGEQILDDHALLIEGGRILDIVPAGNLPGGVRLHERHLLAPGLIDVQVNGGGGVLFNDTPTLEGALAIAAAHRKLGTTSLLPTVITDTPEIMAAAAEAAAHAAAIPGSGVRGIHLEGPFFNPKRAGVHPRHLFRTPDARDLDALCALAARFAPFGRVVLTLAPEQVPPEAITRLAEAGVRVSGGHSAASLECTDAALRAGMTGFTHLFNAMPPLVSRAPGIALAALTDSASYCGIIADGIHVHPAMLRLALATKPTDRIMLVSDAMPCAGTDLAEFVVQGRRILRQDGRLQTEDGVLAGADLDLEQAVRQAVALLGVSTQVALRMASLIPARFLGLDDRLGRLAPGFEADIVLLDERLHVRGSWVAGQPTPAHLRTGRDC
ncbi:N-acetylglucosamine-6-phosphate deacetylase [Lichenicoccus sp.]|uniref:N-acetylglucosamine-6-phosphate deacetylase n=1 Tax=Lichenicoccus sp. TaxID=2781899 RepID=UPI003D09C10B